MKNLTIEITVPRLPFYTVPPLQYPRKISAITVSLPFHVDSSYNTFRVYQNYNNYPRLSTDNPRHSQK